MSLIVLGTMALDHIRTEKEFKENLLGGSASHFAMSARLFTKVHLVSIIGEDFPEEHFKFLKKKKVDLTSVIKNQGKTFRWHGEYKKGNYNNAITLETELGVLESYVPHVAMEHRRLPFVFLANFDPDVQAQFLALMQKPRFVGMDTMNLWINIKRQSVLNLMKKVDLFVANDAEAMALSEQANVIRAAKALRKMGPKFIVIKKGEHGVFFYCDKFQFSFPAYPIETVIDPTGAGDTFAGALMGYLAQTKKVNEANLRKALVYATTLASFNVEGFSTHKTAPLTLAQVHKRMKKYLKFITP
jgi:sugar/nucleoside kinase (ribokinase family)